MRGLELNTVGKSEIFNSNKRTDTNHSKEAMVRVHLGQGRLPFPFLKPALDLIYPNRYFFAAVCFRPFFT